MAAADRTRDLIEVTARLIACMEREVAMLRTMRTHQLQALQAEKAALGELYEAHLRALAEAPAELAAIAPALRGELAEVNARFQRALAENVRALHAIGEVNRRVVKAMAEAVEQQRGSPTGYTRRAAAPARRSAAAPVSVTLNQKA